MWSVFTLVAACVCTLLIVMLLTSPPSLASRSAAPFFHHAPEAHCCVHSGLNPCVIGSEAMLAARITHFVNGT
jgi:hypothetical protein